MNMTNFIINNGEPNSPCNIGIWVSVIFSLNLSLSELFHFSFGNETNPSEKIRKLNILLVARDPRVVVNFYSVMNSYDNYQKKLCAKKLVKRTYTGNNLLG